MTTVVGQAAARAATGVGIQAAMTARWGRRAAILAGTSLVALALCASPAMAACNVSGSTTTCTGNNAAGIGTNTANVIINNLTANLTAAAGNGAVHMQNATSVNIQMEPFDAISTNSVAISLNSSNLNVTANIVGDISASGTTVPMGAVGGIILNTQNGGGSGNISLTQMGNITVVGNRPDDSPNFANFGISLLAGPGGSATLNRTGDISYTYTGTPNSAGTFGATLQGGTGASLTNNGNVTVNAKWGTAMGLAANGGQGNVVVSNTGDIAVTGTGLLVTGINANSQGVGATVNVTSVGDIFTNNIGGIFGQAINVVGDRVTVHSTGNLVTQASNFGGGIQVGGRLIVDNSTTPPTFTTNPSATARVESTGNISTVGTYSPGIAVRSLDGVVTSNGNIDTTGDFSAGIVAGGFYGDDPNFDGSPGPVAHGNPGSVAVINNTGNVTTRGETSVGLLATAETSTINSTGNITTAGANSPAIAAMGKTITVNGTGNLSMSGDTARGVFVAGRVSNPNNYLLPDASADSATVTWAGNISTGRAAGSAGITVLSKDATVNYSGNLFAPGGNFETEEGSGGIIIAGTGVGTVNVSGNIEASTDGILVSSLGGVNINISEGASVHSQYYSAISIPDLMLRMSGVSTADGAITVVNRGSLSGGGVDLTGALPGGVPAAAGARGVSYVSHDGFIGAEQLVNYGVMSGGVAMNWSDTGLNAALPGRFVNAPGGVFSGGFAFAPTILNAGVFSPAGDDAVGVMYLVGNLSQVSGVPIAGGPANGAVADGQYLVNVDFATMTADRIDVIGTAALGGEVVIAPLNFNPQTLQPGASTMRIVNASGGVTNLGLDVADSLLVDYGLTFAPTAVDLTANVDFTPAGLNARAAGITDTLGQLAAAGATTDPFVSQLLGALLTAGTAEEVEAIVRQISPDSLEAQAGQAAPGVTLLAGGMFSCGEREGDYRFNAEGQCGWLRIGARLFNHEGSSDTPAFRDRAESIMGGVQNAISDNWRIGLSAGIEQSDTTVRGLATSDTTRYQFGAVAKGQYGPISVYGAATAGWADAETSRYLTVVGGIAQSEQDITFYGLHGRVSYTYMPGLNWYVRPQARIDAVHVSIDDFRETGVGALGLAVQGRDDWSLSFSPSVEIGGESDNDGNLFRPWIRAGVTVFEDYRSTTVANFIGAPGTVPPFAATSANDDLFADFGVGLNILTQDYEFRLSYEGRISDRTDAHDASVKFIRRF